MGELEAPDRAAELLALVDVVNRSLVGGDRVPERAPGDVGPRRGQDARGVVEGRRPLQAVLRRHADVGQRDVGLPRGALADLARDERRLDPGRALLHHVGADVVVGVAGPHDHEVGEARVADPALVAVDDVAVAKPPDPRLQGDRVRAVLRLGERERSDRLEPGHRPQPALPLLLGAQQRDRVHGQAGVDAVEGADAAVAAGELHGDEPQTGAG